MTHTTPIAALRTVACGLVLALALAGCGAAASQGAADVSDGETTAEQGAAGQDAGGTEINPWGDAERTAREGEPLSSHDATVYTADGDAIRLSELASDGRPLVINFWATWCHFCVEEMPDFYQLVADYGDRVAFAFVDVGTIGDDGELVARDAEVAATEAWLAENDYADLSVYYDADREAGVVYAAPPLPVTVVVGSDGEVDAILDGTIDSARMTELLDAALAD